MRYIIFISVAVLLFILPTACLDKAQREQDLLQAYLQDNNIDTEPTASGLYYIELTEGTGKAPKAGSFVTVDYKGYLIDGTVFDSTYDDGNSFTFTLHSGSVIRGWDEGVSYMREGGAAKLIVPSYLGYGAREVGDIPPYSTLIFEIVLLQVGNR